MSAEASVDHRFNEAAGTRRLPGLDGLRALAVLAVMIFHAGYFAGGWIGVQLFFVLSGFLITRILLRSKDELGARSGGLSEFLVGFYWRRTLRIIPLYGLFVGVLWLSWAVGGVPEAFPQVWPWLCTYSLNFARVLTDFKESPAYSHLWSLAVEEQFYLGWPLIVWFCSRRQLSRVVIGLIVAGPLLRWGSYEIIAEALTHHQALNTAHAVYNLPTTHADAFAWGAALALGWAFLTNRSALRFALAVGVVLATGAVMLVFLRGQRLAGYTSFGFPLGLAWLGEYVWGYTLLNGLFALLLAAVIGERSSSPWVQALQHPVLRYVGVISYGTYVWFGWVQTLLSSLLGLPLYGPLGLKGCLLGVILSLGLAAISFHGFESRFLRFRNVPRFSTGFPWRLGRWRRSRQAGQGTAKPAYAKVTESIARTLP